MLLCVLFSVPAPVLSQVNPEPAACGLPVGGIIFSSVTYSLSADCIQTSILQVNAGITLTINGAGHSISGGSYTLILGASTSTLNLNQLSFDGEDISRTSMVGVAGSLSANSVTFRRGSSGVALNVVGAATLTNMLFDGNVGAAFSPGNGVALNIVAGATVTMTDSVVRNNHYVGGAIAVHGDGSFTANGCLTFSGNLPYNVAGNWTDNSTGACSGTVGNGGSAVIAPPALLSCGLPGKGNLDRSISYTLRSDCDLSASGASQYLWTVSEGVSITVQGNGFSIIGGHGGYLSVIQTAAGGTLTYRNVIVESTLFILFGDIVSEFSTFRNTRDRVFASEAIATFSNTLFENNSTSRSSGNASVFYNLPDYGGGHATFTNVVFRNNMGTGGAPVLNTFGSATITLNGCITFDNNSPANFSGNVTDNSIACADDIVIGPTGPTGPVPDEPRNSPSEPEPKGVVVVVRRKPENCFQKLGAIGIICRPPNRPDATLEIWGVTAESEGFFIMELRQSQVESQQSQGLVASSPDGRVAMRVTGSECIIRDSNNVPRVSGPECVAARLTQGSGAAIGSQRFIIVSMGLTFEGKVHSVVFDNSLAGHVIGTVDTFTGLPGVVATPADTPDASTETSAETASTTTAYAQPVSAQPPRADGSIIHIVQPGDTVNAIALTYKVSAAEIIERNQLADRNYITIGQELVVRDAN